MTLTSDRWQGRTGYALAGLLGGAAALALAGAPAATAGPAPEQPLLREIAGAPDAARLQATVETLVGFAMAMAPSPPAGVKIAGVVTPDTILSWHAAPGPRPASFRVHWRDTTEAAWTHARDAGDADSLTLRNLAIDDFGFGVSSVSADGFESPVVFPGAAGAFWKE